MSDEKLTMRRALLEDAPLLFDMIGEAWQNMKKCRPM